MKHCKISAFLELTVRRHKNISSLLRSEPDLMYFVFEYANKGTLFNFLKENKKSLDSSLKASLGSDIARGLNFLHFNNILHRDIKLDNILVSKRAGNNLLFQLKYENDRYTAVLGDFGIAYNRTSSIRLPQYIGEQNIWRRMDYSSDIRALLFVLWQIDTGIIEHNNALLNPQKVLRDIDAGHPFSAAKSLVVFTPLQKWWNDALLRNLVDSNK